MNIQANNGQMLHLYIANEEVVCDKEISIVEQLKNTNTTILNNCYPLSWEQDKDYVSRYYIPKDYSLFKITKDTASYLATESLDTLTTENNNKLVVSGTQSTIFIGVVKRSKAMDLKPQMPHYATLQVLDFKTFLSEGDLLNFVIDSMTIFKIWICSR